MSKEKTYTAKEAARMCLDGYVMKSTCGTLYRWEDNRFQQSDTFGKSWYSSPNFVFCSYTVHSEPPKEPEPFSEKRLREMLIKVYGSRCDDFIREWAEALVYLRNAK